MTSTRIATLTKDDVYIRDKSLCRDLLGKLSFTEMIYFHVTGRMPNAGQTKVVDACLVALMEHGLTPSALATRLVYSSAKEAMQGAIAAGLLGVGSLFVGTVEGCATLLDRMLAAPDGVEAEATRIAEEHRAAKRPVAGFGHPLHKPDDPRSIVIIQLARDHAVAGERISALEALSRAVDATFQKHITINVTGAVAAALGDAGIPGEILRGFAIIARAAGLVGHVHEEQHDPAMKAIWEAGEAAVPYAGKSDP